MFTRLPIACSLFFIAAASKASTTTITFAGLSDSTFLSTQYSSLGVIFSNAEILTAGISLNQFEFPPRTGVNVATDYSGPMTIDFLTPVSSVSGYFTYAEPLTLDAFSSSSALLGDAVSKFSNNEALSGDPGSSPNEFIELSSSKGISQLRITGDPAGGSFALSDLTFTTGTTSTVPEPSTLFSAAGFLVLIIFMAFVRKASVCERPFRSGAIAWEKTGVSIR